MMKAYLFYFLLTIPFFVFSQETKIMEGLPPDLDKEKILFLKHEPMNITVNPEDSKADKYIYARQKNHNKVIEESNKKLVLAALKYPFKYAFATETSYLKMAESGYKYVLISQVYKNNHLKNHPEEDLLIVFEYFILDMQQNIAYKVFELDEMKVYDSKMMMRKLMREIKKKYPELD